ncbi:hypothetical protein MVEN_02563400 [Mycena venus]|uniref:Uncharacterized protein n=1 Tax=Mycena venus TaxID=2733690 RepID=A0A8H6TZA9_9AGAR|nr:hypothetical protein MVEN_02563400 [Mycena venus]
MLLPLCFFAATAMNTRKRFQSVHLLFTVSDTCSFAVRHRRCVDHRLPDDPHHPREAHYGAIGLTSTPTISAVTGVGPNAASDFSFGPEPSTTSAHETSS